MVVTERRRVRNLAHAGRGAGWIGVPATVIDIVTAIPTAQVGKCAHSPVVVLIIVEVLRGGRFCAVSPPVTSDQHHGADGEACSNSSANGNTGDLPFGERRRTAASSCIIRSARPGWRHCSTSRGCRGNRVGFSRRGSRRRLGR